MMLRPEAQALSYLVPEKYLFLALFADSTVRNTIFFWRMNHKLEILLKGREGYTKDLLQTEITVLHVITSHYLIY